MRSLGWLQGARVWTETETGIFTIRPSSRLTNFRQLHLIGDNNMSEELLNKLLEYFDARIAEEAAIHFAGGGLMESVRADNIMAELFSLIQPNAPVRQPGNRRTKRNDLNE